MHNATIFVLSTLDETENILEIPHSEVPIALTIKSIFVFGIPKEVQDDGFIVKESEVIVIAVPDKPNGLNSTLAILDDANINLEYIYAFVSSNPDEAIVAMKVEDTKKAIGVFEKSNAKILSEEDLEKI